MTDEKKYAKILTDTYISDRVSITEEEASKEVLEAEFAIKQLLNDKENDEELQSAKTIVKDLNGGYSAAMKYEKAKIDFLLDKIEGSRVISTLTGEEE